jgi:hypothetical protein
MFARRLDLAEVVSNGAEQEMSPNYHRRSLRQFGEAK